MPSWALAILLLRLNAVLASPLAFSDCQLPADCESEEVYSHCQSSEETGGGGSPYCFCANGIPRACSEACRGVADAFCRLVCSAYLVCVSTTRAPPALSPALPPRDSWPELRPGKEQTIDEWSDHVTDVMRTFWFLFLLGLALLVVLVYAAFALFRRVTGHWPCVLCVPEHLSARDSTSPVERKLLKDQGSAVPMPL